jgi:Xaa-Pro aminopeptidase
MEDRVYSLPSESQIPENEFRDRTDEIRSRMEKRNIDALVLFGTFHSPAYLMYVANYWPFDTGGAVTLTLDDDPTLFVSDNKKQPRDLSWLDDIIHIGYRDLSIRRISQYIANQLDEVDTLDKVGLVGQSLVSNDIEPQLENQLDDTEIVSTSDIVNRSMSVKSEREVDLLREAARITDDIMQSTLELDLVGRTEKEIANYIDSQWANYDAIPFYRSQQMITTGPVGGPNGNQWVTDREVESGDILTLDCHGIYSGYWSDLARSVAVGDTPEERAELVELSRSAVNFAIEQVKPGVEARTVHQRAVEFLTDRNDEIEYRIIPHPVGLPFIGNPWLAPDQPTGGENMSSRADFELRTNMVYSITCEVALGDHRSFFESVVRVDDKGVERLTNMPLEIEL